MEYIEYELIDISFELLYDFVEGKGGRVVADGSNDEPSEPNEIEYEENGIPIGETYEARQARKELIGKFWSSVDATKRKR